MTQTNIELEKLRMQFEEWYVKQQLDQVATWHPYNENDIISAKQDDGKKYGRYTVFSSKQSHWKTWQAAYFTALEFTKDIPSDNYEHGELVKFGEPVDFLSHDEVSQILFGKTK